MISFAYWNIHLIAQLSIMITGNLIIWNLIECFFKTLSLFDLVTLPLETLLTSEYIDTKQGGGT